MEDHIKPADYKTLVDLSVPIIAERYKIDSVKDGAVYIINKGQRQAFNLHNLILKCKPVTDRNLWKDIIREHFEALFSAFEEKEGIDLENFENIKKYLSIRIYPGDYLAERGGVSGFISRSDLEGTLTLLMFDLPTAFTPVSRQLLATWKKDSSEVFKIAQNNINSQSIEKVTQSFDMDGAKIEVSFLGHENYAASYVLDLANNSPELVGEWGSVVAVPNKGIVDICKVSKSNPVDFVKFIQRAKQMVEASYFNHPQRISKDFFWYYKGKFTKISITTGPDGNINVVAPYALGILMAEDKK